MTVRDLIQELLLNANLDDDVLVGVKENDEFAYVDGYANKLDFHKGEYVCIDAIESEG